MMAGSRVVSSTRRLCHRYQLFFFIAFFLLFMQLFLAYNFYTINQTGIDKLKDWERRVEVIEQDHERHGRREDDDGDSDLGKIVKEAQKQNGLGAAEGPNNVKRLPDINKHRERSESKAHDGADAGQGAARRPRKGRRPGRGGGQALSTTPMNNVTEFQYRPKCEVRSKDALSAVLRARTQTCKQEIADVACRAQEGNLYKRKLPRFCPLKDDNEGEYMGCYRDSARDRILSGYHIEFREDNTPSRCLYFCLRAGFQYSGTQFSYECWCGDHLPREKKTSESRCDSVCSGNNTLTCGGYLTLAVSRTGHGAKPYANAKYVRPQDLLTSERAARIVFVLTVNGRALRQVHRLFKTLYHKDHYYYLHVDSRQEYLHRELSTLAARFPNVRMAPRRKSTIWGGASLLTMLLQCMQDLVNIPTWEWDFFINLSESDYPVKPFNDLTAFLTRYKGKNFVRSHGRDTPRFIRKQGLDKTFHECDTHMWRLGTRYLPEGLRIDGGSDWIGLSRDFCRYLVSSKDELVTGLHNFYKYTLLPAESFFHTLLQNSEFCTTMVNNNLHLTNWRRKQGCKCQYKHIVDWCGCSPNDFLPSDLDKLLGNEDRPVYFARKFEAIVNQDVINELDAYLYGNYPEDTPGLTSYWQNDYHHQDMTTPADDAYLTFYQTFAALGTTQVKSQLGGSGCAYTPDKIQEATLFAFSDQFQGLLVRYTVQGQVGEREFETYVQPQKKYKLIHPVGPVSRIKNLEVGVSFDPKEELFRNFAGLIGPYSDISLIHSWGAGQQFTATVVWIDPAHTVAGSYDVPIKGDEMVANIKPTLAKPLRPGVWTVKLLYLWEVAVETEFLVTPLLVYGGRPITDAEAGMLHQGPQGHYGERDLSDIKAFVQLQDSEGAKKLAAENGAKTGKPLASWVQSLTLQMWHISDTCINGDALSQCPRLASCQQTSWSSLSPDPKSVVGQVKENGRIR